MRDGQEEGNTALHGTTGEGSGVVGRTTCGTISGTVSTLLLKRMGVARAAKKRGPVYRSMRPCHTQSNFAAGGLVCKMNMIWTCYRRLVFNDMEN